jgi:hypothetical protein
LGGSTRVRIGKFGEAECRDACLSGAAGPRIFFGGRDTANWRR